MHRQRDQGRAQERLGLFRGQEARAFPSSASAGRHSQLWPRLALAGLHWQRRSLSAPLALSVKNLPSRVERGATLEQFAKEQDLGFVQINDEDTGSALPV